MLLMKRKLRSKINISKTVAIGDTERIVARKKIPDLLEQQLLVTAASLSTRVTRPNCFLCELRLSYHKC